MGDRVIKMEAKKTLNADKLYSCPKCSYKANRAYNVQRHLANHYEKPPKELQHLCPSTGCTFATLRWDNLQRHIQRMHGPRIESEVVPNDEEIEVEPIETDATLAISDEELASMFIDEIPPELEEEQPAPEPSNVTKQNNKEDPPKPKKKMGRPRKKSGKTKYYECTTCEYRTNRGYNIKRHIAKHIANNGIELLLHVCVIAGCGFSTPRWDNLCRHVKRVHGDPEKPQDESW